MWGCWRGLRKEFPQLPELSARSAFVMVALWGFVFLLALTMISGARELLTPGAWQKHGFTYQVIDQNEPSTLTNGQWEDEAHERPVDERRERLRILGELLINYADSHDGNFPMQLSEAVTNQEWLVLPGSPSVEYHYHPEIQSDSRGELLLAEPNLYRESRFGYLTGGVVARLDLLEETSLHREPSSAQVEAD